MFRKSFHLIVIPNDPTQTRALDLSGAKVLGVALLLALVIPILSVTLYSSLYYRHELTDLEGQVSQDREFGRAKGQLMTTVSNLEAELVEAKKTIKRLEGVMDVELGQMQAGLGPIHDFDPDHLTSSVVEELSQAKRLFFSQQDSDNDTQLVRLQNKVNWLEEEVEGVAFGVDDLVHLNRYKLRYLRSIPIQLPLPGWITSDFGVRRNPYNGVIRLHSGIDIASPKGTDITAPADGVVTFVGYKGGYGKAVIIGHDFGITTLYGHTSDIYVQEGDIIKRGKRLAAVGSTGHSTGYHVHYEIHIDGIPVDPMKYLLDHGS